VRLYFHLTDGSNTIRDETGIEVVDLDAARSELQEITAEMLQSGDFDPSEWIGWRFEVTNSAGVVVMTCSLSLH
jgi:hypothetical protein